MCGVPARDFSPAKDWTIRAQPDDAATFPDTGIKKPPSLKTRRAASDKQELLFSLPEHRAVAGIGGQQAVTA